MPETLRNGAAAITRRRCFWDRQTPSVDSRFQAERGRYHYFSLNSRFAQARMPDVYLIDMRAEQQSRKLYFFKQCSQRTALAESGGRRAVGSSAEPTGLSAVCDVYVLRRGIQVSFLRCGADLSQDGRSFFMPLLRTHGARRAQAVRNAAAF